jgi:hypothetical protein
MWLVVHTLKISVPICLAVSTLSSILDNIGSPITFQGTLSRSKLQQTVL